MGEHRNDLCQLAQSLVDIATGQVPHFKLTRYQIPPLPPLGYLHNLPLALGIWWHLHQRSDQAQQCLLFRSFSAANSPTSTWDSRPP